MTEEKNSDLNVDSNAILKTLCELYPNFSLNNVVSVLPKLINHVEDFSYLDVDEKKMYIVKMIKHIIENTDGPGDDSFWDPILISLVPQTVDLLIDVSKGSIKLNTKTSKLSNLNCCKKKIN